MSAPLPDNISPVAPEQFNEVFLPRTQLGLRLAVAVLAIIYIWLTPKAPTLTPYVVFQGGILIYMLAQSLLTVIVMLNGARPGLIYGISALDVIAALTVLLNDPSPMPAGLFLTFGALGLAAAQHRCQSYGSLFGVTLAAFIGVLSLRQELLHLPFNLAFFSLTTFAIAGLSVLAVVVAHLERLRLRTARITRIDPLTGLGNRWTFYEAAKYLLPYHHRNLTPMVVMFAEIEVTKRKGRKVTKAINDFLLKQFATIADQRLRASDVAVHYGGNEFAFLLVDTTTKDAETIAFDLQQQFSNWAKQKDLPAYAHIGLAVVPHRPVALDQILISINAALFRARQYKKGVSGAVFADPEQVR